MATVYEIITERIMKQLEAGTVPWQKPWNGGGAPKNLVSRKEYRGINVFLLASSGFVSPYWLSFNQVKQLGGSVRKGEKSTPVIFWKRSEYTKKTADETGEESEETKTGLILRYYNVFNTEQCEGLDLSKLPEIATREFEPIEECERIVEHMPKRPDILHEGGRAYYRPSEDSVTMPKHEYFKSDEDYYGTLFHELTHSTGHESRLNRKGVTGTSGDWTAFGTTPYAQEELVAEMGAAFLCGHTGIENPLIDNSASYIASWIKKLRNDSKMVVFAAAQAQKAADFIMGKSN